MPTKAELEARVAELEKQLNAQPSSEYIRSELELLMELDWSSIFFDDGRVKPLAAWPDAARRYVTKLEVSEQYDEDGTMIGKLKKIWLPDKLAVLKTLGTHRDVDAFSRDETLVITEGAAERILARRRQIIIEGEVVDDGQTSGRIESETR